MLISRGIPALKVLAKLQSNGVQLKEAVRHGHVWNYRSAGKPPAKQYVFYAEVVQGFAWWWVLWHLWTQPDHITGEFEYPDASKWTDEELGIPPE